MTKEMLPPEPDSAPGLYPRATLRDVYYTILKHRWPALTVMLAIWLVGILGKYMETPLYRATALMQIDWGKINIVQDVMIDPLRGSADLYGTQEKIIRSRLLAQRVVESERLWEHPLFAPPTDAVVDQPKLIQNISRAIQGMADVKRVQKTQLMEVVFVTPDPALSARLANAHVQQYIQFNVDSDSGMARDTSSFIVEEMEELRHGIQAKEKLLRDYSEQRAIVMGETRDDNIVMQRLETLNMRLAQAEAERASAEAHYINVRRAVPNTLTEVRQSNTVRELERKKMALNDRYDEMSSTFGPDWPEMKRLKKSLDEIDATIDATTREEARKTVGAAKVAYLEAVDREALLRKSLDAQKVNAQDMQHAASDYNEIKVELDNEREMLQGLLRRRSETDLTADLGERQPVRVKIIERAEVPEGRYAPAGRRRLLFVFAIGIALGMGTAYLIDHWDDSIHTVEDLRRHIPLPYLGMIPRYGDKPMLSQLGQRLASQNPPQEVRALPSYQDAKRSSYLPTLYDRRPNLQENRNTLSERFRFLRGSMLLSTPESVPKIVLVTSPDKSCGKTFVSSNLSCALVALNKKVLLIDSDLRNPRLHRVFRYRNRVGLTNVLTGQKSLHDGCIMRTDIENLYLMMSGPRSPNPGELLASPAMERTLQNASEHFDFIILDSAPLLPVFDSHVLSTRCDGVILVARAGVTSRHATIQSMELVERVNGKITGVVLNDVDLDDYAQYYYHSHYSYEYGRYPSEDEPVHLG